MQLLTIEQVAERLQVEERAVNRLLKLGYLAYIDVCVSPKGKKPRKRIREDDLLAFIESRRVVPPPRVTLRERRRRAGLLP